MTHRDQSNSGESSEHLSPPSDTYGEVIDMAIVHGWVTELSDAVLGQLGRGPLAEHRGCNVCKTLRYPEYPNEVLGKNAERALIQFHGVDPMKCGVIYGLARAEYHARWRLGVERLKREHPEAYR